MEENNNSKNTNGPKINFGSYWIYALLATIFIILNIFNYGMSEKKINYAQFEEFAKQGDVQKLEVANGKIAYVTIKPEALTNDRHKDAPKNEFGAEGAQYKFDIGPGDAFARKIEKLNETLQGHRIDPEYVDRPNYLLPILNWVLPLLILVGIWMFVMRKMGGAAGGPGGQLFNIGKSRATLFDKNSKVNVTFADVAGLDEAKEEVMEIVDFLKNPKKYTNLGGKIPKGVLLVGPPGTGKTLLAKAVAGEAAVPFFSISGSDFIEMFVGVGASRVRDLFKQARDKAPCIVFIDEIDAIGRARGRNSIQGGNDERESTLNQLLVEMDGFSTDKGVILMAATNRADVLDSALMRPGRFDRQIEVGAPDLAGREQIFNVHIKAIKVKPEVKTAVLAEMTPGFAGADIANICNEAALIAARRGKEEVDMDDFNYALDRVIGGLEKKNKIISPSEKEIIAYHEAGHAICGWYLEHASPLVKVTIVPRGIGTLGYAQYLPKEEYIVRTEQLLDRICMTFGGRAAEEIVFNKVSTGAQSDLDQVTKMAYSMVGVYGMNPKVGQVSFYGMSKDQLMKPYSDQTAFLIDDEVRILLDIEFKRAQKLLKEKRQELNILAQQLLEKEVLLKSDVERLIGPRPFVAPHTFQSMSEPNADHIPTLNA
ncbi:MAG: ATP-dependent zinc metalloprotease FtsH [Saprospiraceae bacterium]|jgi:AFG3 family protein|nr:ATP-dependent zinc metalloprotease FtsH [Saprospiraceae bacterium]